MRGSTESNTYTHSLTHADANWHCNSNAHRKPDTDCNRDLYHTDSNADRYTYGLHVDSNEPYERACCQSCSHGSVDR